MSFYLGKKKLMNFTINQLDFQKNDGLIPVIVQDKETCKVLMLGYMNPDALEKTIIEKRVTFFSRSKQRLWDKRRIFWKFLKFSQHCQRL